MHTHSEDCDRCKRPQPLPEDWTAVVISKATGKIIATLGTFSSEDLARDECYRRRNRLSAIADLDIRQGPPPWKDGEPEPVV